MLYSLTNIQEILVIPHGSINYHKLTCCKENSMDPDQLALSKATQSGSILFSIEYISGFKQFSKEFTYGFSTVMTKLHSL